MYALSSALRYIRHNPRSIARPWPRFHIARGIHSDVQLDLKGRSNDQRRARGTLGRNLSERYTNFERALRKKQNLMKSQVENEKTVVVHDPEAGPISELSSEAPSHAATPTPSSSSILETFRGFVIPQKPKAPADDGA